MFESLIRRKSASKGQTEPRRRSSRRPSHCRARCHGRPNGARMSGSRPCSGSARWTSAGSQQLIRIKNMSAGGLMAIVTQSAERRRPGPHRAVLAKNPGNGRLDPRRPGRLQVRPERRPRRAACGAKAAARLPRAAAAPRNSVQGVGPLGKVYYTVDVHDISLGGMKVEPIEEYCVGKKVVVVVESLRPVKGEVRWYSRSPRRHRVRQAAGIRRAFRVGRQTARARQPQGVLQRPSLSRIPIFRSSIRRSGYMAEEVAVLAGGCFWCTEAVFLDVVGVKSVESGYTGGHGANPTYKQVCGGDTGHAEAIRDHLRSRPNLLRRSARHLLRDARSDPAQPPGQRHRHSVSLGDLPAERGAGAQGAGSDRARQRRRITAASSPRSSRWANGIRPRMITRIIGPAKGSATPIAWRSIPPKLQKLRKSFQAVPNRQQSSLTSTRQR